MQKSFSTQPELFVPSADLEHPGLQGLDGAEAVLDWAKLERLRVQSHKQGAGKK
jgi:IS5 family transposase